MRLFPALSDRCPIAQSNNASAVLESTDCLFGLLERAWQDAKASRSAGGAPGGFAHVAAFVSILDDGHPGATSAWLRLSGRHKSAFRFAGGQKHLVPSLDSWLRHTFAVAAVGSPWSSALAMANHLSRLTSSFFLVLLLTCPHAVRLLGSKLLLADLAASAGPWATCVRPPLLCGYTAHPLLA